MQNLFTILGCPKIEINDFLNRSFSEKKERNDLGYCDMEMPFKNIDLPVFSDQQRDHMPINEVTDFNKWREIIELKIIDKEKSKPDNIEKNYEVEHSFVDF